MALHEPSLLVHLSLTRPLAIGWDVLLVARLLASFLLESLNAREPRSINIGRKSRISNPSKITPNVVQDRCVTSGKTPPGLYFPCVEIALSASETVRLRLIPSRNVEVET